MEGNKWWYEVHESPVPVTAEKIRELYEKCIVSGNISAFEEELNHAMQGEEG